ncbi:TPA: gp53-like domain-containing protein [Serratia marcescens]
MAKNDFKPFAIGEFSNVISQADYEALPAVGAGFNTGIARSEQLNKVWRQSSVMAAVLGNFIGEQSGDDVLDDGDLNKLKLSLEKAIFQYLTNSEADDRYVLKTTKVNEKELSGDITLGPDDIKAYPKTGGELNGFLTSNGNITVKNGNFIASNASYYFHDSEGNILGYLQMNNLGDFVFRSVKSGKGFVLGADGNVNIDFGGGHFLEGGVRVYSPGNKPDELHVDGASWWSQDSSGKITQGGIVNRSANSNPVSFSKPFPNAVLSIQLTLRDVNSSGGSTDNIIAQNVTNSGFSTWMNANELSAYWMAVGY